MNEKKREFAIFSKYMFMEYARKATREKNSQRRPPPRDSRATIEKHAQHSPLFFFVRVGMGKEEVTLGATTVARETRKTAFSSERVCGPIGNVQTSPAQAHLSTPVGWQMVTTDDAK